MEVTQPRHIAPGNTYLITRRCSERRFFLRPDPVTTHLFLYALAEAAARFGIRVNAWLPMSNHYHAVVEDPDGVLPAFLCHFHKMVARSINTRWERRENFWSPDPASVVRLVQPEDVLDKTVYALVNPIAAHLVERLCDWPGASSFDFLDGAVQTLERPQTFYREDGTMPEAVQLRAEAPTDWPGGAEAWAAAVRAGVEARVRAITEKRRAAGGRVVGRKKLLTLDHNSKPSEAEAPRGLRPEIACLDPHRLVVELSALACFRAAYAEARAVLISGVRAIFPWGTYKFVQELGAPCQPRPAPA
jgi:putative transposase